ncbi:MAG: polysaccharide deacetylase family protein [Saprospiraceae bacterium]|nr:polysaccharide deacetylase family protein [Saprospiraceae bacterium]
MYWIRIRYQLALVYRHLLFWLGLGKKLLRNRPGKCIVVFHGVDIAGNVDINSRFVSKEYLEEFMAYISRNFNVVSIENYFNNKIEENSFNIAVTFDDGYLNNYTYAVPILEKYQIPASFYFTTIPDRTSFLWPDFLDLVTHYSQLKEVLFEGKIYRKNSNGEFETQGVTLKNRCRQLPYTQVSQLYEIFAEDWEKIQRRELDDYWALMTKEQIGLLAGNPLFRVGCHGYTHANLAELGLDHARSEIWRCKEWLEEVCENEISEFAFPFGEYTQDLVAYCEELGFIRILLMEYKHLRDMENERLQNRISVNPHISIKHQIACILKGSYF